MRTYALLVSILIALAATTYGDIAIDVPNYGGFDPGSPGYPGVSQRPATPWTIQKAEAGPAIYISMDVS